MPFLLSSSLCLLGLPVTGLVKGDTCIFHGKQLGHGPWREGQASTCCMHLSCHSKMGPHEHSGHCQLSPRSDKYSTHLEPGDPGRRTRPCHPGCWYVQLQDLQPTADWGNLPPRLSFWGRDPKPAVLSALVQLEALLTARLPRQAPLCPGPDPDPSCLGTQQQERLGYFKQVMSVLPSLSLSILPEALITVAGWICWTKRANGLIDMIWQLICNLIILSSRTHYSLFITLLSSRVCCSHALRITEHTFLSEKSQ